MMLTGRVVIELDSSVIEPNVSTDCVGTEEEKKVEGGAAIDQLSHFSFSSKILL